LGKQIVNSGTIASNTMMGKTGLAVLSASPGAKRENDAPKRLVEFH